MDINAIQKVYRRYAQGYDVYFGALLQPGRKKIIEKMHCRPGDRILEVGVGTGLSLPLYPRSVHVTGIDISREMLARARARKARLHLDHVTALRLMDAESLRFPADSFDKVVAMYVVSVAPHPARLVSEMRRACRPGGELFIVNHFQHANPVVGGLERLFAPLSRLMGFHPDFSLENFLRDSGLDVAERTPVNALGYWTLLRARNGKTAARIGESRTAVV
ncbi:MAG TPA: methyltransferase domain-containing protein [Sulfuricaulis sp.]|nr:methyltransferase domain-containing protein [Sulfuricaulis sp.]